MSTSFSDRRGRSWSIELNFGLARRIKRDHAVDFVNWQDGKAYTALLDDEKLVAVLWCLVADQASAAAVDEEAFAQGLCGDVLAEALEAITEAVVVFTRPDRRELVREVANLGQKAAAKAIPRALELAASQETDQALDRAIDKAAKEATRRLATTGT